MTVGCRVDRDGPGGKYSVPGGISSRRVVWLRKVLSIFAFHLMMAVEIARTVYLLLFAIRLLSTSSLKTAFRIMDISSMNSVAFLPRLPVAEHTKGIKRPAWPCGRNLSYIRDFRSSSMEVAMLLFLSLPAAR